MNPYNTSVFLCRRTLDRRADNPPSVFDAKRLIGRKFSDVEVQSDMKHFPFKVIDKGGKPYIRIKYSGEDKEFVGLIVSEPYRVFNLVFISLRKKSPPWS